MNWVSQRFSIPPQAGLLGESGVLTSTWYGLTPRCSSALNCLEPGGGGMKIFDGFEEIEIFPSHKCPYCATHLHSFTHQSALFFLQRFKADEMAMTALRQMAREDGHDSGPQIPNDEVLERVAARLAGGKLHVIWKPLVFGTGASKPASGEKRPQVQAAPPPPSKAEGPPAPAPDEPVFDPDADPDAIANVLTHAAQSGVPFCEE